MTDRDRTQAFYDRWARLYDVLATAPGIRTWRVRAVSSLGLSPGDTVVEMGVGTGANLPPLRKAVGDGGRVVGVDLSRGMLGVARRRVARAGWENVHLVRGDATRPPLGGPVDAVLGSFVVGMVPNPTAVIGTWGALVEPDGRLGLLEAVRSEHPLAKPANLAFRAFIRATAPDRRGGPEPPVAVLESRFADARDALAAATTDVDESRFAGGFVRVLSGKLPGDG